MVAITKAAEWREDYRNTINAAKVPLNCSPFLSLLPFLSVASTSAAVPEKGDTLAVGCTELRNHKHKKQQNTNT